MENILISICKLCNLEKTLAYEFVKNVITGENVGLLAHISKHTCEPLEHEKMGKNTF